MESPFVAQSVAQVTVRPRKLGYLIQAGSRSHVRRAIRYASTEWGGIGHPIVPVRQNRRIDPGWWQMLDDLHPEILIDYVGIGDILRHELRQRVGAEVVEERMLRWDEPGIHTLVTVLPGSLRGRTLLVAPPEATIITEAAVGVLPSDPDNVRLWSECGATHSVIASSQDLLDAQLDVPSPLWVTRRQYRTYVSTVLGAPVIVYCDPRPGLSSVVRFWNVRAAGAAVGGVHVLWLPADRLEDQGVGERLRGLCLAKVQTLPDLLLLGPDEDSLDRAAQAIGFNHDTGSKSSISFSSTGRDLSKTPLSYWRGSYDPRGFVLGDRSEGVQVSVPLTVTRPSAVLHFQSPIPFNPTISGKLRVDIDQVEPITWPRRETTARLIADQAEWTRGGLGFVFAPTTIYRIPLRVPDAAAVLTACLGDAGWTWSVSDKGRYAGALLGAVGDRSSVAALRDPLCLRVIRALASLSSRKAGQLFRANLPPSVTDQQIAEAVATVIPALVPRWLTSNEISSALSSVGPTVKRATVVVALNQLIGDQLVARAFRFECSNCGLTTYIPLDRSADRVTCDGCTVQSALRGTAGEPDLTYGLNSLLDRAADQDCHGHLPVQDWMRDNLEVIWSVPGADLMSAAGTNREIDVLAISRSEVLISEVKSSVGGFPDPVVLSAAQLASDLKADHLVLAALDDWTADRKAEVAALAIGHGPRMTVIGLEDLKR